MGEFFARFPMPTAAKTPAKKAATPRKTAVKKTESKAPEIETAEVEVIAAEVAQTNPAVRKKAAPKAKLNGGAVEAATPDKYIIVKGARQHNLKNIDVNIPRDKLVVITGLSGSGKSSLAFDTIYAEGQRRYVESLSSYARQFLGQMDKPDVDFVEGLSPAISIDQKTASRNPRSTVATVTEIYDYLRLLYARAGTPHCPECGRVVARQTVDQIVDRILELPEGTRLHILAPLVRGRKGEYKKIFEDARKKGFARARINGQIYNLDETEDIKLERYEKQDIEIVVDRIVAKESERMRIADSVQTTLKMAEGIVMVEIVTRDGDPEVGEKVLTFSEHFACAYDGISFEELEPRTFSFNSPYGACTECSGLGFQQEFDAQLVVPDGRLAIDNGALAPWRRSNSNYKKQMMLALEKEFGFSVSTPWNELSDKAKDIVLNGSGDQKVHITYTNMHGRKKSYHIAWEGVLNSLKREYTELGDQWREELGKYMSDRPCPSCAGARLKPFPRAVTVGKKSISEATSISVGDAARFFGELKRQSELKFGEDSHNDGNPFTNEVSDAKLDVTAKDLAKRQDELTRGERNGKVKGTVVMGDEAVATPQDTDALISLSERERTIARPIVKEIQERLQFLVDVGFGLFIVG